MLRKFVFRILRWGAIRRGKGRRSRKKILSKFFLHKFVLLIVLRFSINGIIIFNLSLIFWNLWNYHDYCLVFYFLCMSFYCIIIQIQLSLTNRHTYKYFFYDNSCTSHLECNIFVLNIVNADISLGRNKTFTLEEKLYAVLQDRLTR